MSKGVVISLFDYSTNMVKPWAEAGYRCDCLDINHPQEPGEDGNVTKWHMDLMHSVPGYPKHPARPTIVFAFPPCNHLSVSGARWFKGKGLRLFAEAILLVAAAAEICESFGAPYMIENPVSTLSTYWRKPDYTFDPCDYGDPYTKKTCLWTGNGFVMPEKNRVEPTDGSKMHKMGPSSDRARKRSETPMGFARAVFEANSQEVPHERLG